MHKQDLILTPQGETCETQTDHYFTWNQATEEQTGRWGLDSAHPRMVARCDQ